MPMNARFGATDRRGRGTFKLSVNIVCLRIYWLVHTDIQSIIKKMKKLSISNQEIGEYYNQALLSASFRCTQGVDNWRGGAGQKVSVHCDRTMMYLQFLFCRSWGY